VVKAFRTAPLMLILGGSLVMGLAGGLEATHAAIVISGESRLHTNAFYSQFAGAASDESHITNMNSSGEANRGQFGNTSSGRWRTAASGADATVLFYDLDMYRQGYKFSDALLSSNAVVLGNFKFRVDEDTDYRVSGAFSSQGPAMAHARWGVNRLPGGPIFEEVKENTATADGTFTVGGAEFSDTSYLIGSSTGTLHAGFDYNFTFFYSVWRRPDASVSENELATSASVSDAWARIDFNNGAIPPVPEPTSLAMWAGLGIMGLVSMRRRRRSA